MKKKFILLLTIPIISACKKEAGEGGNSSIKGSVQAISRLIVTNPNTGVDTLAASDRDVYILYGDNITLGDRIRTNYKGEFEFKYLRPGDYTVYVYSDDTTGTVNENSSAFHLMEMKTTITITYKKQVVEVPQFTIYEDV